MKKIILICFVSFGIMQVQGQTLEQSNTQLYFKKILEVEPDNQNANKYIRIPEKDSAAKNN